MLHCHSLLDVSRRIRAPGRCGNGAGLMGVPIGIKDLLWTKGLPTTSAATTSYRDRDGNPL